MSAVAATGTSGSSNAVAPASTNVKTEGISSTSTTSNLVQEPADAAVVAYLQKRGLGSAALELTQLLEQDSSKRAKTTVDLSTTAIQADEAHARHQRTALSLATGGGLGYDVDAAPAVAATEAIQIAARCHASAIVVRAGNEQRGLVARLARELSEASAEFIGGILNRPRQSIGGYFRRNYELMTTYGQSEGDDKS